MMEILVYEDRIVEKDDFNYMWKSWYYGRFSICISKNYIEPQLFYRNVLSELHNIIERVFLESI